MKKRIIPHSGLLGSREAGRPGRNNFSRVCALTAVALFLTMLALPAASLADEADTAMEVIKTNVEAVLEVLRDPAMQDEAAEEQKKDAIRKISNEMFNWPLFARYVLAKNRNDFNDDQKQEFISLLKVKLENLYISRILAYKDETIEYVSSEIMSNNKAKVLTRVISGGSPVELTYRLGLANGKWGVYDVTIGTGTSLGLEYRKDVREFLADKTPAQLLEHMSK
jgi:phospholipid transport system substrate-binding protein